MYVYIETIDPKIIYACHLSQKIQMESYMKIKRQIIEVNGIKPNAVINILVPYRAQYCAQ